VSSLGLAYAVNKAAERYGVKARIHLKFDTGLNRIGMHYRKAPLVFERLLPLKNIDIVGLYSHFSTSDEPDGTYARLQLKRFKKVLEHARNAGIQPRYTHIACSGALINHPESFFNMVRVGLAMYGLYPSRETPRTLDLKPVLSFKSRIVFMKNVSEGSPISYGRTFYTQRRTRIATVPVGYGDGYNRKLSNNGFVLIHGKRCPIVGVVCMDQIMVDVGGVPEARVGDIVVLYGAQGDDIITVEEIAERVGTIPYEVTCWLARRVPRVYIGGDDPVEGNV
jgi:alanine racemase